MIKKPLIPLIILLLSLSACYSSEDKIPVIDTHIHLFDVDRLSGLPWPEKSDKVLYKSILAVDYNKVIEQNNLAGVIVVEASPRVSDNDWVLHQTKKYKDKYIGLIGALEFDKKRFKEDLNRFCEEPRFLGLRIGTQYLDKPHNNKYLEDPVVLNNLQLLSDAQKTLDVLIYKLNLDDVILIAKKYSELKIIINHVGGIVIDGKKPAKKWETKTNEAARYPNVYCKVSGLFQRCSTQPASKNMQHYKKVLNVVYKQFGEDRLIFGSNWPCTLYSGNFAEHKKVINDYFKTKGPKVLKKLYYQNAKKIYALD
jgi:L-fuconolactonase